MQKLKAIVIGATGATGKELVKKLLEDKDFSTVSIFVRKSPKIKHKKIIINEIYYRVPISRTRVVLIYEKFLIYNVSK